MSEGRDRLWTSESIQVADALQDSGFETRLVGGRVRDALSRRPPKDIDMVTSASRGDMLRTAEARGLRTVPSARKTMDDGVYNAHGTILFVVDGTPVEVTTLKGTVPSFHADAEARDFTINSMSVDRSGRLHDPFGGERDLRDGVVAFTGDAMARIAEDPARSLRFFRFRASHGADTERARRSHAAAMSAITETSRSAPPIAGERIWREVSIMLSSPEGVAQFAEMDATGLLDVIGYPFGRSEGEGTTDPLGLTAVAAASGADSAVALGFSLVRSPGRSGPGLQEVRSAWRFSNETMSTARTAMHLYWNGGDTFRSFLDVALAPSGPGPERVASVLVGFGRGRDAERLLAELPVFPVEGADLVEAGMATGPEIGAILSRMRRLWTESGYSSTKEDLMERAMRPPSRPGGI